MSRRFIALLLAPLFASGGVAAADLGRLFFTPQERAQLERQYFVSAEPGAKPARTLIVNGVIQREGGKRIIWVNGEQKTAGTADSRSPASVPVVLPGKTDPVQVKVGQRLMLDQAEPSPGK